MMDLVLLVTGVTVGGYLAYQILKPKPNAVVLEKYGENYLLSKAYHNEYYLRYRGLTLPIPSTYEYWVMLGRGFRLIPKWYRFFYVDNARLYDIKHDGNVQSAVDTKLISDFVRTQTVAQILRGLTIPKMTVLMYLIAGILAGLLLGVVLGGWFK
jgi:hypothetical protein